MKKNWCIFMLFFTNTVYGADLAIVGEKKISVEQLRSEFSQLTDEQREAVNKDFTTKRSVVENAINSELLVQAATKAGLDKDKEYLQAMEQFKKQFLASKFMQSAVEPKLKPDEMKKYYASNKSLFDTTQVCASHIVVSDMDSAVSLIEELKKKGTKKGVVDPKIFSQIAVKKSIDPTVNDNRGNLGCFTRDRMVSEFSAAAFNMKKKTISQEPVRTVFGYHVILVNDVKPGNVSGFEEVEKKVKDSLRVKLMQELISELRAKSTVNINEEAVKDLKF